MFSALGLPIERRNFHYDAMLYPLARARPRGRSVYFQMLARQKPRSGWAFWLLPYIDLGFEGIHSGSILEIMNHNDPHLDHYARVFALVRPYAKKYARRGMVSATPTASEPRGGLVAMVS